MRRLEVLSPAQVEQFLRDGFVRLPATVAPAVAKEIAEAALVKLADEQGIDPRHPKEFRAQIGRQHGEPFAQLNTPMFLQALDDLLAPAAYDRQHIESHGCFFFSFPGFHESPWRPPYGFGPWHVDLGHERVERFDLGSGSCALVPIFLLTDTSPGGGATVIVPGSHRAVARLLYAAGGSLPRWYLSAFCEHVVTEKVRTLEVTGQAGDVFLLHPLLIHTASTNCGARVRVICNTGIGLTEPRRWMRDGEVHSPVDRAIHESIAGLSGRTPRTSAIQRAACLNHLVWQAKRALASPRNDRHGFANPVWARAFSAMGRRFIGPLDWLWDTPSSML